eukprot:TRINITY_DN3244_c0_g1_i4.p1 TRINITY_DN3244_c0_g1~~TRINITY_DN3244_c0_g1_i4.p1  ORF type:complete len:142 (+),score=15.96 TRINITY_DN3244_c0_g1_i4:324-749(+)
MHLTIQHVLKHQVGKSNHVPVVVCANKIDLLQRDSHHKDRISQYVSLIREGHTFCEVLPSSCSRFIETSAKYDQNVDNAFETLVSLVLGKKSGTIRQRQLLDEKQDSAEDENDSSGNEENDAENDPENQPRRSERSCCHIL